MNKLWSELNKTMQTQIKKKDTYKAGIETLIHLRNQLIRNFLNLGIIESRNYIRISYGSFLYAGTNGISPFS